MDLSHRCLSGNRKTSCTTLVAAVIVGQVLYVANVGDSRAYLLRGRHLTQITTDHSWVEEQIRAGFLTRKQAEKHPQRNLITRALGIKPTVEVDLFTEKLRPHDLLLLCTDGLSNALDVRQIARILDSMPPEEAATELVAQAAIRAGNDNASAVLVRASPRTANARVAPPGCPPPAPGRRWGGAPGDRHSLGPNSGCSIRRQSRVVMPPQRVTPSSRVSLMILFGSKRPVVQTSFMPVAGPINAPAWKPETWKSGLDMIAEDTGGFYVKTHEFAGRAVKKLHRAISGHYEIVLIKPVEHRGTHSVRINVKIRGAEVYTRKVFTD